MRAAEHPRQADRLRALCAYDILDTPREAEFDEIADLAAAICAAPIAVVNFVDAERQWFKAEVGLGVRETPIATSICSHAILEGAFLEIADTRADPRTRDNPLCPADPGLRFYAGALLETEDGLPIGTLCVLDYRPRTLTPLQRKALAVLARQVMKQIELRIALQCQDVLRREIDHRVRNSLQTVASMINLQRARVGDPRARDAFDEISRRVASIILLHQELQQTSVAERVDLGSYIGKVGELLRRSAPETVSMAVVSDDIWVTSQQASAVAVIVSEFVANSLKYAFPGGRAGKIRIEMRAGADGTVRIDCADDGVGLRDARSPEAEGGSGVREARLPEAHRGEADADAGGGSGSGLGMRIVEASAGQIGGTIERLSDGPGYRIALTFPLDM
jgi:two-component sensor histidine kinase